MDRMFGFYACSGAECSDFHVRVLDMFGFCRYSARSVVRAALAALHDSKVPKQVLSFTNRVRVVRENLWKSCGKTWGKVGGESCGKNVEKSEMASCTHKIGPTCTFWVGLWESFTRGFTHKITEVGRGFAHFPQSLLLLLLNI